MKPSYNFAQLMRLIHTANEKELQIITDVFLEEGRLYSAFHYILLEKAIQIREFINRKTRET